MAEAIAGLVLSKLADAAVKEAFFLYGAGDKLDALRHELSYIQAFLKDAESKRNSGERVKTWLNDVQELAYRIEDAIDSFMVDVNGGNRHIKVNALKQKLKCITKLGTIHNLTSEMDKIVIELDRIKELTDKYGINSELGDSSSGAEQRRPFREVIHPDEDDPDIVGLQQDTENIIKLLLDPNTKGRTVSIVGQGGLGKTTLARKVYNRDKIKEEFKFRLWIPISQQYNILNLLKMMLEKIRPLQEYEKAFSQNNNQHSQQMAQQHFITELKASLSQKRYLIILDDVWEDVLWIQIKSALPDVGNGSRVLITTRSSNIAKKADPISDPYELCFLSKEESQQLLLKKAFRSHNPKPYLHELLDLPNKFVERCGGLPLALIVVGGLLSIKPTTYYSWHKVFETFSWQDDKGNKCTEILETSYEDLPFFLKPCFLYFGLFLEDSQIKAKSLIRMWVAERSIPVKDGGTMEETAEDHLEELVQRSMVQVSHRHCNGSIKFCRIHDLLHDLAIKKGKENRFLKIIPSQDENCSSDVRRVALHHDCNNIMENTGPNLRSLFSFNCDWPSLEKFRFLKILNNIDLIGPYKNINGDVFKKLTQLRYIETTQKLYLDPYNGSSRWPERKFWKSIGRMRNLQTLYIPRVYNNTTLPDCIWVKTLRHVCVDKCYGPPSNVDLPNLQTLKAALVRAKWLTKGWPRMPNIEVLDIHWPAKVSFNQESFCTFLSKLSRLTSLRVSTWNAFLWNDNIQSLDVCGKWIAPAQEIVRVTTSSFPIHLIKLKLEHSRITEDPMPILEKLESLKLLSLGWHAYVGRELYCSAGGFPRLQFMILNSLGELEEWKADVEEDAKPMMPMLKEIELSICPKLCRIPGLRHMTSLGKLTLRGACPDLKQSLREDESHKIREGQFVQFQID